MTPLLSLGNISIKNTIASELGNILCELSTNNTSLACKSKRKEKSVFSKGLRMTVSARSSISAESVVNLSTVDKGLVGVLNLAYYERPEERIIRIRKEDLCPEICYRFRRKYKRTFGR